MPTANALILINTNVISLFVCLATFFQLPFQLKELAKLFLPFLCECWIALEKKTGHVVFEVHTLNRWIHRCIKNNLSNQNGKWSLTTTDANGMINHFNFASVYSGNFSFSNYNSKADFSALFLTKPKWKEKWELKKNQRLIWIDCSYQESKNDV